MAELVQATEQQHDLTPVVRQFLAQRCHRLLDALEPYIDGTMGPVSSRHVGNYLTTLKLLGTLYRVYDKTPVPPAEPTPETVRAEILRDLVLGQLTELEARARR